MAMPVVIAVRRLMLTQRTPAGTVLDDPVKKRLFETDIVPHFFALNPLMPEDFSTFS